eukprot:TRINITY_DN1879_c0_g1_i2.p1 TRINITY_DN1879_c0_g1~~TRINITY_DN1879_c0_g1_i2.p1  ORF type:complete len:108 (+),score=3.72 TRINITY_DN1879_c0_g1_i2:145-468(+)
MAENSALLNGLPAGYDSVQNLGQQMFGEYNLPMLNNMVFSDVGGFNYVNNPQNVFSPAQPCILISSTSMSDHIFRRLLCQLLPRVVQALHRQRCPHQPNKRTPVREE